MAMTLSSKDQAPAKDHEPGDARDSAGELERAKRVRRSAIPLGLVALAFYLAFIAMSVLGFRQ